MTERFWEHIAQGLGKAVLKSYNNGETAVNGYSPAQVLILSVSCHVLQSWFFTYNTISFEDFTFFCVLLPLSLGAKYEFDLSKLVHYFYVHESRPLD